MLFQWLPQFKNAGKWPETPFRVNKFEEAKRFMEEMNLTENAMI